jgi:excisionase family DNA binding protein
MDEFLTVPDVAKKLGIADETVRRWLRDGRLEGVMLGRRAGWRIRPESVTKMLEAMQLMGKLAA